MSDDFPTLLLPMNAKSGKPTHFPEKFGGVGGFGHWSIVTLLTTYLAERTRVASKSLCIRFVTCCAFTGSDDSHGSAGRPHGTSSTSLASDAEAEVEVEGRGVGAGFGRALLFFFIVRFPPPPPPLGRPPPPPPPLFFLGFLLFCVALFAFAGDEAARDATIRACVWYAYEPVMIGTPISLDWKWVECDIDFEHMEASPTRNGHLLCRAQIFNIRTPLTAYPHITAAIRQSVVGGVPNGGGANCELRVEKKGKEKKRKEKGQKG